MPTLQDSSESDNELARRWQAGDGRAAELLIDRHLSKLRAFLATRCGSQTEADDLAQDVFVAACRHIESFRADGNFSGWLYGIARNKVADFWRRQHPTETFEERHAGIDARSPSLIHEESDRAAQVWAEVFARLPETQAAALWLRIQEEMHLEEIASALDVTLSNAKVLLFRARQTLAAHWNSRTALS